MSGRRAQSNSRFARVPTDRCRHFWLSFAILLLLFGATFPSQSAEVGCDSTYDGTGFRNEESNKKAFPLGFRPKIGMCAVGYIVGEIQPGDFEKVRKLYAANHPYLWAFQLNSLGGDVEEAMTIGRLFRRYLIEAYAPEKIFGVSTLFWADKASCVDNSESECVCASACALIWFGAVRREGRVGLHRPRITSSAFSNAVPEEAENYYKHELKHVSKYLEEMEVPGTVIEKMLSTRSSDVQWVDESQELQLSPSYSEWIDATCGSFSEEERNTERKLESQKSRGLALSNNDRMLLKTLKDEDGHHATCMIDKSSSSKEALPAP